MKKNQKHHQNPKPVILRSTNHEFNTTHISKGKRERESERAYEKA